MKQIDDLLSNLFKDYFKDFEITEPSIEGKSCGHKLKRMCTCHDCKNFSLYCLNDTCEKSYQKHTFCKNSITLKGVTELLKKHFSKNKEFLEKMIIIEDGLIQELTRNKEQIIRRMSFGNLQEKYQRIVEEIYRKGNGEYLKGKQADQFLNKLIFLSQVQNHSDQYLHKFELAAKKVFKDLVSVKEVVLNQYLSSIKEISYFSVVAQEFDSVILKKDDPKYQQNISFIFQSLDNPKQLQLLFRASENQFLASKFHEKCDDIAQTFSIIRTEFGKTIAGYNHLKWNIGNGGYLVDYEKKCFLLSIDLKQKMILIDHKKAIINNQTYGPTFGGGTSDIYVVNKCNQSNNSHAYFPSAYNLASNPYANNQASYTAFSGATNGYKMRIIDYEVQHSLILLYQAILFFPKLKCSVRFKLIRNCNLQNQQYYKYHLLILITYLTPLIKVITRN